MLYSGKRDRRRRFWDLRMAIVEVGVTETNEEAWLRHLAAHPEDLSANIRIFNHKKVWENERVCEPLEDTTKKRATPTRLGGVPMILKEIRAKARDLGVKNYSKLNKIDLIRAIQSQEGNSPCFQNIYDCRQYDCLWRPECQC